VDVGTLHGYREAIASLSAQVSAVNSQEGQSENRGIVRRGSVVTSE
jgi:hypothetical protein